MKKQKFPIEKQDFHLIRPVCALGTFPSRGRLEKALSFLTLWFFDRLKSRRVTPAASDCRQSLAEFFARRQKISLIIFAGGMYVGENTSRSESVDMCASGAHEARV